MYQNSKSTRQVTNRSKSSSDYQYHYYEQGVNAWCIMLRENRGKPQNHILNFMKSMEFLLIKQSKQFKVVYEKIVTETR